MRQDSAVSKAEVGAVSQNGHSKHRYSVYVQPGEGDEVEEGGGKRALQVAARDHPARQRSRTARRKVTAMLGEKDANATRELGSLS